VFLKRSFYTLSKTHHPDHNPSDPHAPKRFMRISEAYTVLSHSDRRARYDRDVMRLRTHSTHHAHRHSGSYSSTGPAGGRPASGLSRRRGTFTGPPPSFFRSGGWGAHGAKRRAAHEDSTGTAGMGRGGGMGPGQDPTHSAEGAAPHFDHEGHERMHRRYEGRRAKRAEEGGPVVDTGSFGRFVVVTVSLVFAFGVPWWLATRGDGRGRKKKDAG
jgi:curved DNA-binding protein CbpA